jgi:hypothetical protein
MRALTYCALGSRPKIVDRHTGETLAVRVSGAWVDPFGGTFDAIQLASFDFDMVCAREVRARRDKHRGRGRTRRFRWQRKA